MSKQSEPTLRYQMTFNKTSLSMFSICTTIALATICIAQPPRGGGRGPSGVGPGGPGPSRGGANAATTLDAFIAKWLTMDGNADGQLSTDEMKDERLKHLFKSSDKNADGVLTKEEMKLLFEASSSSRSSGQGPGPGGRPPR
jgi:EF hand